MALSIWDRARCLLTPKATFGMPAVEVPYEGPISPPQSPQFILRMMVRTPNSNGFQIPDELLWLKPVIERTNSVQLSNGISNPFVYVTVRSGNVITKTDDLWHVDGFSMRTPHVPEQNYIWTDVYGTEVLEQEFKLPDDFDPMGHNLHQYFQDRACTPARTLEPKKLWAIDPYVIHRRPSLPETVWRTFFRISFVPIEIEDDTCTVNPLIPRLKPYGREDIHLRLQRYV